MESLSIIADHVIQYVRAGSLAWEARTRVEQWIVLGVLGVALLAFALIQRRRSQLARRASMANPVNPAHVRKRDAIYSLGKDVVASSKVWCRVVTACAPVTPLAFSLASLPLAHSPCCYQHHSRAPLVF